MISLNARFRHYNTVVRPEYFYTAKTIARKGMKEIEKRECKFLRKFFGPKKVTEDIHRSNMKFYKKYEKIGTTMRK